MKKKILIILDSDLYIRNYIDTGVIKYLKKYFDVKLLASQKIYNKKKLFIDKNTDLKFYLFNNFAEKIFFFLNDIKIFLEKHKSTSFVLRFENINSKISLRNKIFRKITLNKLFYFFIKKILDIYLIKFSNIKKNINKSYDLILFPSSGLDLMSYYLPKIVKKKIKTFYLVDNWDNISSKSYYINQPDYIGVWGDQSKYHAIKIQDFDKKKVFSIGTPRFDVYLKKKLKKIYKFKYILFLGSSTLAREQEVLEALNEILNKNKKIFKNCRIVYRPHPWRKKNDKVHVGHLNKVVIDYQLRSIFNKNIFKTNFQPDLTYYPRLIKFSEIVVGGLTSMMIESLIMKKNYLAFAFHDKKFFYNPKKRIENLEHFKILKKIKNIKICKKLEQEEIEHYLILTWKNKKIIYKKNLHLFLNKIVLHSNHNYKLNLKNLINKIIA